MIAKVYIALLGSIILNEFLLIEVGPSHNIIDFIGCQCTEHPHIAKVLLLWHRRSPNKGRGALKGGAPPLPYCMY